MLTIDERIRETEEEIRKTPYHKGTEHYIGKLKARIAKLREEKIEKIFKSRSNGGGGGYGIKKTGDASVVLVGPPSVGKSTLLNKITHAESKVAAYDFTTLNIIPGMLDYKGAKIQIFDVPGIMAGAASGRGRGKEVLSVARNADLIMVMVDVKTVNLIPQILKELHEAGVRLNEEKPRVSIIKKLSGGIKVNSMTTLELGYDTIKSLAGEFHLTNAEVIIKENISIERLIDVFMGNRAYLPYLMVINKADLGMPKNLDKYLPPGVEPLFVSGIKDKNLDELKEVLWQKLQFIRVYLKNNDEIDKNDPLIIKKGSSLFWILENIAIPKKENFKSAKVFGPGAKYPGQEVSLSFVPLDETVVQFE